MVGLLLGGLAFITKAFFAVAIRKTFHAFDLAGCCRRCRNAAAAVGAAPQVPDHLADSPAGTGGIGVSGGDRALPVVIDNHDKGSIFKYLAGRTGILVCYGGGISVAFTAATAAVSFALIRRLHTGHPERHRDDLLGIQAGGQTARQLIGKIGIVGRQGEIQVVGPHQTVIGQGKLAVVHITGGHGRQAD